MIDKKKVLLMLATAAISCSVAATAFAAPGKFNVKADELEYDRQLLIMLPLIAKLKLVP